MLKRLLVLLDETPSSASARRYALALAQCMGAEMAGLAGIDLTFIEAPMPGRIGATAYKVRLQEKLKEQADEARKRLHDLLEQECRTHRVPFEWLSFEGDPVESVRSATETRDLVIAGHDTAFRGNVHEPLSDTLASLLSTTPRPVIVCPDELSAADDVMIAYDASVPAMRSVQMFVLMGLAHGNRIHVTSVDPSAELATRRATAATSYLRHHGYQVDANPVASRTHPTEALRTEAKDRKIGTLVMGAYGHRGVRELLLGSTTTALVERPPCALFVYH